MPQLQSGIKVVGKIYLPPSETRRYCKSLFTEEQIAELQHRCVPTYDDEFGEDYYPWDIRN